MTTVTGPLRDPNQAGVIAANNAATLTNFEQWWLTAEPIDRLVYATKRGDIDQHVGPDIFSVRDSLIAQKERIADLEAEIKVLRATVLRGLWLAGDVNQYKLVASPDDLLPTPWVPASYFEFKQYVEDARAAGYLPGAEEISK